MLLVTSQLSFLRPFARACSSFSKVAGEPATPETSTSNRRRKKNVQPIGKFAELPGAELGKVVVRFPPEESGYLHLGHAKAALINEHYRKKFQGKFIMRFDDTNPEKTSACYEKIIKEDLALLEIVPDQWTHSSDHFEFLLQCCERLLREEKAFVDDTDNATLRMEKSEGIESRNRNNSTEKNLQLWEEMKKGSPEGQKCCVRFKINMKHTNVVFRDPIIYRCKVANHIRTGDRYNVYPTYEFACPIIDSVEGVTHALRTMEYDEWDPQYYFTCDTLGIRRPYIYSFCRLNMNNVLLSKRQLTKLVDEKIVSGWDDPRMPTIRGLFRRGMTIKALRQFLHDLGSSRAKTVREWDKMWVYNNKVIDPIAPRYTALEICSGGKTDKEDLVPVTIRQSFSAEQRPVVLNPNNSASGTKDVWFSSKVFLEQVDAATLKQDDVVTFLRWGNVKIARIDTKNDLITGLTVDLDLENKDYKNTLKITWLSEAPNVRIKTVHYDHVINKATVGRDEDFSQLINRNSEHHKNLLGEAALAKLRKGDIIQLMRKGFYICDKTADESSPLVLIEIPGNPVS